MDNKNNLVSNQLAAEYPHSLSDVYIRHKELEALEEEDDDFFSESESEEEINDADEVEDEE